MLFFSIWTAASFYSSSSYSYGERCNNMWFWHSVERQHNSRWQLSGIFDMWWWNLYFSNSERLSKMSYTINTFTHLLCSQTGKWMLCTVCTSTGSPCCIWAHICKFTPNVYEWIQRKCWMTGVTSYWNHPLHKRLGVICLMH